MGAREDWRLHQGLVMKGFSVYQSLPGDRALRLRGGPTYHWPTYDTEPTVLEPL